MGGIPETRQSLILRLRRPDDVEAWEEFVAIYEPLMVRMARRRGMQEADTRELVQEVMISVATAVSRWSPDAEGQFRGWLLTIFRNQLIDHFRRQSRRAATGGDDFDALVDHHAQVESELTGEIEQEYRRELFRRAAAQVRGEVEERTWQAFWRTSVDGAPVAEAAAELEMSVGSVYAARSRVVARIRVRVRKFEEQDAL